MTGREWEIPVLSPKLAAVPRREGAARRCGGGSAVPPSRAALRRRSQRGLQAPSGAGGRPGRRGRAGTAPHLRQGGREGRKEGRSAGGRGPGAVPERKAARCSRRQPRSTAAARAGRGWCCREQGPRGTDRVRKKTEGEGGKKGGREAGEGEREGRSRRSGAAFPLSLSPLL